MTRKDKKQKQGAGRNGYTGINRVLQSEAIQTIFNHLSDGTFSEFLDDWKWIFSFSSRYKLIIFFYTLVGILALRCPWARPTSGAS
ncbi:MAG: hypothetical protein IJR65_06505 [Oscillospiraceae bacterium]|nr:hypothetical protein [Oscillospiraceae bacterium]